MQAVRHAWTIWSYQHRHRPRYWKRVAQFRLWKPARRLWEEVKTGPKWAGRFKLTIQDIDKPADKPKVIERIKRRKAKP